MPASPERPGWRDGTLASLVLLACAIVLVPLVTSQVASRRIASALEGARAEALVMRRIYDFSFAFRSLQVNAQNLLLNGGTTELRERYATSRDLVMSGIDELALIPALWPAAEDATRLRTALHDKIALFDEAVAAREAGDLARANERAAASTADFGTRRIFGELMGRQRARVEATTADAAAAQSWSDRSIWWGAVMQVLILVAAGITIGRAFQRGHRQRQEIAALAARLRENVDALTATNAELTAFTHHVAHDLRAPIRHIAVHGVRLESLVERAGNTAERAALAGIAQGTGRMGRLIDGLLEYARLGRAPIARARVDTAALVDALVAQEREAHPRQPVAFTRGALPVVDGDATLLHSVFHNLIDNAFKFTRDCAAPRVHVDCEAIDDGRAYRFVVADNGAGFEPQHAQQLFGIFRQLDAKNYPGSGVGLAIVRRIVDRLGGATWAHGTPGGGASFYFTLPRATTVDAEAPAVPA